MSSVFTGLTGLRSKYRDLSVATINSATNQATSALLVKVAQGARMSFIDNSTDVDIALMLVNPAADASDPTNRLFWLEIPAGRIMNFDTTSAPSIELDPGTSMYAYKVSGTATLGKLRILVWG